ncbi:hypothetical protein Ana3638_05765 [Anaerocolumna sedimenticola]|uniref:Alpha galactosidase C-terminal domain-containing protein n=1 Tax=Anaerocolumna sedimenticola TaxID=2696063 RepID=A0A6P1TJP6_9FIRM|nr:hypothetical protein [Anaerocolumna sedimenticola]QHQ60339.1 hypothetical protein Ana3638_05765 [Anaerocolumna sedimenticola]
MNLFSISNYKAKFEIDINTGIYSLDFIDGVRFLNLTCAIRKKGEDIVLGSDMKFHEVDIAEQEDILGKGNRLTVQHYNTRDFILEQTVTCYDSGYMTVKLKVISEDRVSTNYMAPLWGESSEPVFISKKKEIRFLAAPFDNDKWAKFVDYPVQYAPISYEFTAIHSIEEKAGLVIGSLDHDNWKTGIKMKAEAKGELINGFRVFAGVATEETRDLDGINHGYLSGKTIESPRIFLSFYDSYQEGFKEFGKCNALIKPPLPWNGPVLFGWNSWAALMGRLTFEKYKEASDFMKKIKHSYCDENGTQYINFDAFWNSFITKMRDSVDYVNNNGQLPGTYVAPFITSPPFNKEVSGTDGNYLFEDLLLRDESGEILPPVDGLYSLDPTHPGTLAHIQYETSRIIKWGFRSIKADFLGHACREGSFYNKEITTGIQAYNYGMKFFTDCVSEDRVGYPIFISLSIDPIFPHGYGHARRISCDAFGSIDQSAYLNNCITYLWWMNDCLYRFNDPDHIVLYRTHDKVSTAFEEGRTRFHTGVICGSLMITSDDYELEEARRRAEILLTNDEINEIARKGQSFQPVSGNYGEVAADVFMRKDKDATVVAVFNYSLSEPKTVKVPLTDLGLNKEDTYSYKDLWTKEIKPCHELLEVELGPTQSAMIKIFNYN